MFLNGNKNRKRGFFADYQQRKLENPFFKKKERIVSFAGLKAKLIAIAVLIIIGLVIWFIFISAFWKIKQISFTGLDQSTDAEVRNLIAEQMAARNYWILPQNNLLFFNEEKFRRTLKEKYRFQQLMIEKKWPDKLAINVIEKPIICIWSEQSKYYFADTDGYVVGEINPLDLQEKKYPLIANESANLVYNGKINLDPAYLAAAAEIYAKAAAKIPGIIIDRFIVDNDVDTIKLQTTGGLRISFDAKGDLDGQLDRLAILKTQKLKDDFASKKKIDLRFGDKIYYQ